MEKKWLYKKIIIELKDPSDFDLETYMNKYGQECWEIFSITEKIDKEWVLYGESHKFVSYVLYMKKLSD